MRLLLLAVFAIISTLGFAQKSDLNKNILKNGRDRVVVGLDWTGWSQNQTDVSQKWYNRGFHIYLTGDRPFNEKFSLGVGGGISFSNLYHDGVVNRDTGNIINFTPLSDSLDYSTNKFSFVNLELPIELKYLGKADARGNRFKLAVGGKFSYNIHNFYKYKGPGNEFGVNVEETKMKQYDIPGFSRFQYGPTMRVGYGPINLEVYYSVPTLFEGNSVPEMNTLRIGISFNNL